MHLHKMNYNLTAGEMELYAQYVECFQLRHDVTFKSLREQIDLKPQETAYLMPQLKRISCMVD